MVSDDIAAQTVGELIEELGSEQAALIHIMAYNTKLRMAVVDVLTEWSVGDLSSVSDAIRHLRIVLNEGKMGGA